MAKDTKKFLKYFDIILKKSFSGTEIEVSKIKCPEDDKEDFIRALQFCVISGIVYYSCRNPLKIKRIAY